MQRLKKFQEGMSSDDIEEKLRYVSQVVDVANEIGKAETISSLIPFLNGDLIKCVVICRLVSR